MNNYIPRNFKSGQNRQFLETHNLPKVKQEDAGSWFGWTVVSDIEAVIKKLPTHKSPGPDGLMGEFFKTFREELNPYPA